jgi:hypothetical protein
MNASGACFPKLTRSEVATLSSYHWRASSNCPSDNATAPGLQRKVHHAAIGLASSARLSEEVGIAVRDLRNNATLPRCCREASVPVVRSWLMPGSHDFSAVVIPLRGAIGRPACMANAHAVLADICKW